MKPEPLPGARLTVSESRRCGATQGHAYGRHPGLERLVRRASPHQAPVTFASTIGVAEAIMVSTWALSQNDRARVYPDALGGDRGRGGVLLYTCLEKPSRSSRVLGPIQASSGVYSEIVFRRATRAEIACYFFSFCFFFNFFLLNSLLNHISGDIL